MGTTDKVKDKVQGMKAQVKSAVGWATRERDTEAEGERDKTLGRMKQAGEKVKDPFRGEGYAK